jgi:hypothetical protein
MKESVAAAAQFIKTHANGVGLPNDWLSHYDIAVLAAQAIRHHLDRLHPPPILKDPRGVANFLRGRQAGPAFAGDTPGGERIGKLILDPRPFALLYYVVLGGKILRIVFL